MTSPPTPAPPVSPAYDRQQNHYTSPAAAATSASRTAEPASTSPRQKAKPQRRAKSIADPGPPPTKQPLVHHKVDIGIPTGIRMQRRPIFLRPPGSRLGIASSRGMARLLTDPGDHHRQRGVAMIPRRIPPRHPRRSPVHRVEMHDRGPRPSHGNTGRSRPAAGRSSRYILYAPHHRQDRPAGSFCPPAAYPVSLQEEVWRSLGEDLQFETPARTAASEVKVAAPVTGDFAGKSKNLSLRLNFKVRPLRQIARSTNAPEPHSSPRRSPTGVAAEQPQNAP